MADVQNSPDSDPAPTLTVTQARQGFRGRHIAWVLGISMALVVIGFVALYLSQVPRVNAGTGGQTTADAKTLQQAGGFHAPIPQPRETQTPQSAPTLAPQSAGKGG